MFKIREYIIYILQNLFAGMISDGHGMMSTDTQQLTAAASALANGYHPGVHTNELTDDPPTVPGVYYDANEMGTQFNPYLQFPEGQTLIQNHPSGTHPRQVCGDFHEDSLENRFCF